MKSSVRMVRGPTVLAPLHPHADMKVAGAVADIPPPVRTGPIVKKRIDVAVDVTGPVEHPHSGLSQVAADVRLSHISSTTTGRKRRTMVRMTTLRTKRKRMNRHTSHIKHLCPPSL